MEVVKSFHRRYSVKKGVRTEAYNFIKKETLAQVFSCEFSKNFINSFLTEHLWATGSKLWHLVILFNCL